VSGSTLRRIPIGRPLVSGVRVALGASVLMAVLGPEQASPATVSMITSSVKGSDGTTYGATDHLVDGCEADHRQGQSPKEWLLAWAGDTPTAERPSRRWPLRRRSPHRGRGPDRQRTPTHSGHRRHEGLADLRQGCQHGHHHPPGGQRAAPHAVRVHKGQRIYAAGCCPTRRMSSTRPTYRCWGSPA
jgi:hypothetical protein